MLFCKYCGKRSTNTAGSCDDPGCPSKEPQVWVNGVGIPQSWYAQRQSGKP